MQRSGEPVWRDDPQLAHSTGLLSLNHRRNFISNLILKSSNLVNALPLQTDPQKVCSQIGLCMFDGIHSVR